ncbi:hypothetical protein TIFTF001_024887 [Ficus carica]|uniref:Uncharacterized protein n=1 Tax=Ficus carica TaxID=3494 RepID=A0AA88AN56_FICCA|nr:hypothetical protein TIFTF001_024887 [Ficus carica]
MGLMFTPARLHPNRRQPSPPVSLSTVAPHQPSYELLIPHSPSNRELAGLASCKRRNGRRDGAIGGSAVLGGNGANGDKVAKPRGGGGGGDRWWRRP